jgi:hypothetical protein
MRILAATVAVALSLVTAATAALLSTDKLIERWQEANGYCRGGSGEETMSWCAVRDGFDAILLIRGWCYGKVGEAGYQMRWHPCGPDSNLRRGNSFEQGAPDKRTQRAFAARVRD